MLRGLRRDLIEPEVTPVSVTGQVDGSYGHASHSRRVLDANRLFAADESTPQPVPEQQRSENHGRIAVDEAPDQRVTREQLPAHVDLHHRRRNHLGGARRARRGSKEQKEGYEGWYYQDLHEGRGWPEPPHRDVAGQELVGMR